MNRRKFVKNLIAGSAGFFIGTTPFRLLADNRNIIISILHTNDIHCHIEPFIGSNERYNGKGGIARISQYAKNIRSQNLNTLLFDAGDMFQGTPYFNYFKGEAILKAMSAAGYDAGTIGNHEFDNGLEGILNPLKFAQFPLINSNYDFSKTILAGKFPRWKIFERSGIRIGVYGLGVELQGLVSEKNFGEVVYNDPLKTALEMELFLHKNKKCDLVVCLSHLGLEFKEEKISDLKLASETSFTDLIIGGHTHTYLQEPKQVENRRGEKIIVNQAWWGGLMIGRIDFVFDVHSKRKTAIFANIDNS